MALFKSTDDKTTKENEKVMKLLRKYGLENLNEKKDVESVRTIFYGLMGTGMMKAGMTLSLTGKPYEVLPVHYQRAIIEQNWIIIRQLDRLCKLLEENKD